MIIYKKSLKFEIAFIQNSCKEKNSQLMITSYILTNMKIMITSRVTRTWDTRRDLWGNLGNGQNDSSVKMTDSWKKLLEILKIIWQVRFNHKFHYYYIRLSSIFSIIVFGKSINHYFIWITSRKWFKVLTI